MLNLKVFMAGIGTGKISLCIILKNRILIQSNDIKHRHTSLLKFFHFQRVGTKKADFCNQLFLYLIPYTMYFLSSIFIFIFCNLYFLYFL